jgi:superoxide dismutase, Fe-Mn family
MKKVFLSVFFAASVSCASSGTLKSLNSEKFPVKLPELGYKTDSLMPSIDKETMEIHHSRHHKAYVDNANKALPNEKSTVIDILKNVSKLTETVRNNVGGHWNHSFFWLMLTPEPKNQQMPERLNKEITAAFGSVDNFKAEVEKAAMSRFGSGWVWLIRNQEGKLQVVSSAYQDNPLMDNAPVRGIPVFGIDIWEHAYYLKYQNKRGEYLKEIWKVINWSQVNKFDQEAQKLKL